MKKNISFIEKNISRNQRLIDDYTTEAKSKNLIWAFTEMDITEAQKKLRAYKENGVKISFTAFLIACYARSAEKYKYPINTLRYKKKKYITFDEVDVMTNIERTIDGVKKPVNYTVRNAHKKTLREINDELNEARTVKKVALTTGNKGGKKLLKLVPKLPRFLRKIIIHKTFIDPFLKKKLLGTIGLSAVGMFGKDINQLGWMIHITPHTISVGVGSIEKKFEMQKDGNIKEREFLAVTIAMDHAIIDGGPATRFFRDFYLMLRDNCLEADWCFKSL
ncbi:2-oxo acid dehydrogenase subunit E2 [Promethearchaeum syntrophicum]|uniref:2-oxo acid dehydrogenase subunit E2 n=1 Tax=Promethearchaeum syntrophicum TaxID=2594042 RepID=A0A5B9D927_9ARCH|nr:2-oxo acid dehydrogenase subunit E2 [Candidatus Prometheoarchaeum syntrophicum]QEE15659.1 branched-chain alpha-keto acid dehydrogenase subunit E2 [Candidatus Prometheoarchaeum syntrophicum]